MRNRRHSILISIICGIGLLGPFHLRASLVDSWTALYYASSSYTGKLASFSDLSIDFCNNRDTYGIAAPYSKKYHTNAPVSLCLWIHNKEASPALLSLSLGNYISSGTIDEWWDLLPWQCSHSSGFGYDYIIATHETLLASWDIAPVVVDGYDYQQFYFYVNTGLTISANWIQGCIRAWEYIPNHRPKPHMWLFTVNFVRVRPFAIRFDDTKDISYPSLSPHNLPSDNLLDDHLYHLSKANSRSFLLQYRVVNTWTSSFELLSSWSLSSFLTTIPFSGLYDLPPQSSVVVSHRLPINLFSRWRYNLELEDALLVSSPHGVVQDWPYFSRFSQKFPSFPRMIYFFALLIIIWYNMYAWFYSPRWRRHKAHHKKRFNEVKTHEKS